MFYVIGLGLGDPKDITVKGLEIVKRCERVYLESYTSIMTCGHEKLVSSCLCKVITGLVVGLVLETWSQCKFLNDYS